MNKTGTIRLANDIVIVVAVLHGWWFVVLPFGVIGAWKFRYFIEIVLAGIIYDALFGLTPDLGWRGYLGTILSICLYMLVFAGKKILRN